MTVDLFVYHLSVKIKRIQLLPFPPWMPVLLATGQDGVRHLFKERLEGEDLVRRRVRGTGSLDPVDLE